MKAALVFIYSIIYKQKRDSYASQHSFLELFINNQVILVTIIQYVQ
jgi:hypothetical protein